jgi:hypothetical protein
MRKEVAWTRFFVGSVGCVRREEVSLIETVRYGGKDMSMEDIEMSKHRAALDKDVEKLLDKYIKIMDWDIPEVDGAKVRRLILDEIKQAIDRLENQ